MTLKEAISKAEKMRQSKISAIVDCGDRWAFGFEEDKGKYGSAPVFVFKENGKSEFFFVGDYFMFLEKGQDVTLPD